MSKGSLFLPTTSLSIRTRFSPSRPNAPTASASDVHVGVSRCPRYISSDECLDRISSSEMPSRVYSWLVMVRMKKRSGLRSSYAYSSDPGSVMARRLTVGRFGT